MQFLLLGMHAASVPWRTTLANVLSGSALYVQPAVLAGYEMSWVFQGSGVTPHFVALKLAASSAGNCCCRHCREQHTFSVVSTEVIFGT